MKKYKSLLTRVFVIGCMVGIVGCGKETGTDLAKDYESGLFTDLTKEEYLEMLIHSLELLSPDIVIHRLTGDGPKDLLLALLWSRNKKDVLNTLHSQMRLRNTYQGRLFHATRPIDTL